jgi:hypothetical protein
MKNVIFGIAIIASLGIGYFVGKNNSTPAKEKELKMQNPNVMSDSNIRVLRDNYMTYLKRIGNGTLDSSMSLHITFKKEIFQRMGKILENDSLYGVRVYMIRYNNSYTATDINNPNPREYEIPGLRIGGQNSIVFVPVNQNRQPVYNVFNKKVNKDDPGGYNHGDLCPTICNDDY